MYLHETLEDIDGNSYNGVGIIKGKAFKTSKLGRFGYINLSVEKGDFFKEWCQSDGSSDEIDSATCCNIGVMPAHEFHYFDSTDPGDCLFAQKPASSVNWSCIHSTDTMLAGFPHFYYYGNTALPMAFLRKCRKYGSKNLKG